MAFFKENKMPSCEICRYATEYIPNYTYRFSDPFCSKGHGKCSGEKLCGDFREFGRYYCEDCNYLKYDDNKSFCIKKECFVDKFHYACAYIKR